MGSPVGVPDSVDVSVALWVTERLSVPEGRRLAVRVSLGDQVRVHDHEAMRDTETVADRRDREGDVALGEIVPLLEVVACAIQEDEQDTLVLRVMLGLCVTVGRGVTESVGLSDSVQDPLRDSRELWVWEPDCVPEGSAEREALWVLLDESLEGEGLPVAVDGEQDPEGLVKVGERE